MELSTQAINSLTLYSGAPVGTIKLALNLQSKKVVNELYAFTNSSTIDELAIKLSKSEY